ncbi:hypothetical protein OYC64_018166 [Pagothenia borchgrevinki]|uniref:Secreted protein n=1 Tax=Pagothenia borchgrevinki TaxID=8213 RepID=A0ABD2GQH5_PAGBO
MGAAVVVCGPLIALHCTASPPLQSISQKPPSLVLSHKDDRHSLTQTRPSIPSARSAGGVPCFVGKRADVQPEEERTFIVSVAGQKRFLLPLRKSLYASVCVCVCVCV